MNDNFITSMVTIVTAIVGLALIAVIVSNKANTSGVLSSAGQALSTTINAAVSPVTGNTGGGWTGAGGAGYPAYL